jgi:hypothetical protein
LCSLIPGLGVKLSTIILAGPTVLYAVKEREDLVRQAAVANQQVGADFKTSCGCEKAGPDIAERVEAPAWL